MRTHFYMLWILIRSVLRVLWVIMRWCLILPFFLIAFLTWAITRFCTEDEVLWKWLKSPRSFNKYEKSPVSAFMDNDHGLSNKTTEYNNNDFTYDFGFWIFVRLLESVLIPYKKLKVIAEKELQEKHNLPTNKELLVRPVYKEMEN